MAANMSAMERGDRISSETGERAASPRRVVGIQPAIAASRLDSKVSDDEAPLSDALSDDDEDTPRERESFIKRTAADASTGSSSAKMKSALHANATRLRWYQLAFLSTYWFGWSFLWLPLFVVIIPKQVAEIAGDQTKGAALGSTLLLGSFSSLVCAPMFGSMSDTCTMQFGRRRPFILAGTVLASVALIVLAFTQTLYWFSLMFLLLSVANNMILAPCAALLPDLVPADQRGIASGWIGGFTVAGSLAGGFLCYHTDVLHISGAYGVLTFVHALSTCITLYCVHEKPLSPDMVVHYTFGGRLKSFISPMFAHDFRVVFWTRFLMQMGILTVQEYLQYYLKDAIGPVYILYGTVVATTEEKAVSILFIPVLVGALLTSLCTGWLSDFLGGRRKFILYISAVMMGIACVFFSITRSYTLDMVLGLLFGLGYGAFSVIDWAMATDVLPNEREYAKDMGVWTLALVLPQVIAAPVAGNLLDYFNTIGPDFKLGYSMIFLLAVVYYAAGSYYIKYVNSVL